MNVNSAMTLIAITTNLLAISVTTNQQQPSEQRARQSVEEALSLHRGAALFNLQMIKGTLMVIFCIGSYVHNLAF